MKITAPGQFKSFNEMEPGNVFSYRWHNGENQVAMKVIGDGVEKIIRFDRGATPDVVMVHESAYLANRTLLGTDGLEIEVLDRHSYIGVHELDGGVSSGWLGFAGGRTFLSVRNSHPAAIPPTVYLDLTDNSVVPTIPGRAVWYREWRIIRPTDGGPEVIFEMRQPEAQTTRAA